MGNLLAETDTTFGKIQFYRGYPGGKARGGTCPSAECEEPTKLLKDVDNDMTAFMVTLDHDGEWVNLGYTRNWGHYACIVRLYEQAVEQFMDVTPAETTESYSADSTDFRGRQRDLVEALMAHGRLENVEYHAGAPRTSRYTWSVPVRVE